MPATLRFLVIKYQIGAVSSLFRASIQHNCHPLAEWHPACLLSCRSQRSLVGLDWSQL